MPQLRLSGGEYGGRRLEVPAGVRPTEGRVREALLSIWQPRLRGARWLDLFAGSGAVGLEALGRGAVSVVFVEGDPIVARVLRRNLETIAPQGSWRVLRASLPQGVGTIARAAEPPFDLVFADPPYRFEAHARLVAETARLLAPGGELAVEHSARVAWRDADGLRLERVARRCYGDSCLTFYRLADGQEASSTR
jgi:16S rRNA (guanine966-N2)-methyltransferase